MKRTILGAVILLLMALGFVAIFPMGATNPQPGRRGGVGSERVIYDGYLNGNHVTVWKVRTSDFNTLYITTGNNGNISVIQPR